VNRSAYASIAGACGFLLALTTTRTSFAGFTLFEGNFNAWSSAAGTHQTIGFEGFPVNTFITTQYLDMGVEFTSFGGPNVVRPFAPDFFLQDGYGIDGNEVVEVLFSAPTFSIAAHKPGFWRFHLFAGDSLIYDSGFIGGSGLNKFAGITSTMPFDRVRFITDPGGDVYVDNIYFTSVPGPGSVAVLLGAFVARKRRRAQH
jgi:hypothetical protein